VKDQFAETYPDPDDDDDPDAMLRHEPTRMTKSEARTWALAAHLSPLMVGFLGPLVIWLIKKDESEYVARHAKEALNFQISMFIWLSISAVLIIVIVGFFLLMALSVLMVVFPIIAAVKSNEGKSYKYPLTLRLIT
jgi:uncharacterized Tic20 family protein